MPTRRPAAGPTLQATALAGDLAPLTQPTHDRHRRMEGAARQGPAGAHEALDDERHTLGQLLDAEQHAEVVGNRIKAAGMDQARPGADRLVVMGQPHPVHELGLAGEVDVVGAGPGAGGDERLAVVDVRADGADHHLGAGQAFAHRLELCPVAPGPPSAGRGRCAPGIRRSVHR